MDTSNIKENTLFAGINSINPNNDSEEVPTKPVSSSRKENNVLSTQQRQSAVSLGYHDSGIEDSTTINFIKGNKKEFSKHPDQRLIESTLSAFNKSTKEIVLTPSQESTVNMCIKLIPDFKILVIKGETSSGKYVVASEVFKRLDAVVEYFDLCELAKFTPRELSNQDIINYLDRLLYRLNTRMNKLNKSNKFNICDTMINDGLPIYFSEISGCKQIAQSGHPEGSYGTSRNIKRSRYQRDLESNISKMTEHSIESNLKRLSKISLDNNEAEICSNSKINKVQVETRERKIPGIIYIRHYNRIADVLTDCYAKVRFLLPLVLKTFSERMPHDVRIIITTQGCMLPEGLHWCTDLNTTRQDMEHILRPFCLDGTISQAEFQHIMKISKTVPVGRILYCLRYSIAMSRNEPSRYYEIKECQSVVSGNILNSVTMLSESVTIKEKDNDGFSKNIFIEAYRKALGKFSGSTVDIDKDVPKPIPEDDLVGIEDIIDEITTSILNPMMLGVPGIPLKKGLLLCGPPGTGKTSIGRWLAHQIKGKFYLIGGEAGINGSSLIDTFQSTVTRARDNAPAVVFIDDGDVLFEHDDTYRAFLTILDGIETNKRNDVCVILTCMNMRNVPASLLRGGRLEMALVTRLPDTKKIQIILERSLEKMKNTLYSYDSSISEAISISINKEFISDISYRMAGWNCADIHRCVNDVTRLIVAGKLDPNLNIHLKDLFHRCIKQVKDQYLLCGKCESTDIDYRPHDAYIM